MFTVKGTGGLNILLLENLNRRKLKKSLPDDATKYSPSGIAALGLDYTYIDSGSSSVDDREMRSRLERQSEHNMFSIPFLSSAATLACIADSERDAMRLRSEIMELIARTRDTIAQSRALITEAEQCWKRLDYASTDLHCVQKSGTETLQ